MPQPKAHKYKRSQRLSIAKAWIKTNNGKKLYHGYAKHFGVNKLCAIHELEMLGFEFTTELKESIKRSEDDKRIRKEMLKKKKMDSLSLSMVESDFYYAYIAGYTSGGAPYGTNWEEFEALEKKMWLNNIEEKEDIEVYNIESEDNTENLPF
jgi:hypothetical protein